MRVTYVIDAQGDVKQIPVEEKEAALRNGNVLATPQQVQESKLRATAESDPLMAAAGGIVKGGINTLTAIPRALSAGANLVSPGIAPDLSGWTGEEALKALDRQATRDAYAAHGMKLDAVDEARIMDQLDRERSARLSTTAGQVGNVIGSVAGSGPLMGLGGAAKAASGLGGEGAGLLSRMAASGIEGGAAMAPVGLADASEQAHNEGRALTGEQALASVAHAVIGGAGIGAGLTGLGGLVGKLAGRGAERTSAAGETLTPEGLPEPQKPGALARILGATSGKDPQTIQDMIEISPRGRENRNLAVYEGDATRESAERSIRSHVNQLETSLRNITPEWRSGKLDNVAKVIARDPEAMAQQSALAQDALAGVREQIDAMGDKDVFGARGDVNRMAASLRVTEKKVASALETGRPEDVFTALDTLKKDVGPIGRRFERATSSAERETFGAAQNIQEQLRQTLEHDAWGGAGAMQRDVNQAFAEWLPTRKLFKNRFLTETGQEGWETVHGADPGKIGSYVRGLLDPAKDLDHALVDKYLTSTQKLTKALSSAGELTPDKAAELEAVTKSAEGFQTEMGSAGKALSAANKLDQLRGGGQHGIGVGAMVGSAIGGHVGGVLGGVLGAMTNPAAIVERLAVAERLAGRSAATVSGALDNLFSGIGETAERARSVAAPLGQALKLSSLELFQGTHETPETAYRNRLQEVVEAPTALPDRIAHALGPQGLQDPALALAAYASANRAIEYLKQHLPEGQYDLNSLTPQSTQTSPSKAAIAEYADVWSAVMRPRDVLAGIPDGTVSPKQMEAIGHVYPSWFQNIRQQAMQRVEDADTKGHEIPLRQRTILDQLFDLDAAAGPTFSVDFASKYGPLMGDASQKKKNKPNPGAKPVLGQRLQTLSQTMMGT